MGELSVGYGLSDKLVSFTWKPCQGETMGGSGGPPPSGVPCRRPGIPDGLRQSVSKVPLPRASLCRKCS